MVDSRVCVDPSARATRVDGRSEQCPDNYRDPSSDKQGSSLIEKAERAIKCAGDTPELQRAVEIVRCLVASL